MTRRSLLYGTMILFFTGIIVKVLGFGYRIVSSNVIGAEGMGLMQLVTPIYMMIILTLTSGVSISVSRMTAKYIAIGKLEQAWQVVRKAIYVMLWMGVIVSSVLWYFAEEIAFRIIGDGRTFLPLIAIAPSITFILCSATIKGCFYGMQKALSPAVAQLIEQCIRFGFILIFADYIQTSGLEFGCAMMIIGSGIGEIVGLVFLIIILYWKPLIPLQGKDIVYSKEIEKELFKNAVPISINRFIISCLSALELLLIPIMLQKYGLNYTESLETLGKFSGMAIPLILFPAVATSALAITLVPALAEAHSIQNHSSLHVKISKSINGSVLLGSIFSAIFLLRAEEISDLVYKNQGIGEFVYQLSFLCIFVYLQQTVTGIMNGLGKQGINLFTSVIGYGIKIASVVLFIPLYGMKGYIIGNLCSYFIMCIMNIIFIVKETNMFIDLKRWLIQPSLLYFGLLLFGQYYEGLAKEWEFGIIAQWIGFLLVIITTVSLLYLRDVWIRILQFRKKRFY